LEPATVKRVYAPSMIALTAGPERGGPFRATLQQEGFMNFRFLMCFTAITLLVALTIVVPVAGQDNKDHNQHHHYKLIDLATFGGSTGWLCNDQTFGGGACPVLSR